MLSVKCTACHLFCFLFCYFTYLYVSLSSPVATINLAKADSDAVQQRESQRDKNTTKDDIARLLHLFKEPSAQRHWSNLYGILSRMQLDARKSSGEQAETAQPLACLAELFNDYQGFQPQNVMVQYASRGSQRRPMKKQPYQPSSPEWATLANHCHDIEPTNESRRHIIHGEAWIKETWNDCRKYLHQTFQQYNRSGQHDSDMDEWCSEKEMERWVRATQWKTPGKFFSFFFFLSFFCHLTFSFFGLGANSVIRFPSAMVYSIAVLEQKDFESIGRQMPSGTGVDASMDGDTGRGQKRKKRGKYKKKNDTGNKSGNDNNNGIAAVIESIGNHESKLSALRLLIEFGNATEKRQALLEVKKLAYQQATPLPAPAPNANSGDAGHDVQGDDASENGAEEGVDNNDDDDASDSTDGSL